MLAGGGGQKKVEVGDGFTDEELAGFELGEDFPASEVRGQSGEAWADEFVVAALAVGVVLFEEAPLNFGVADDGGGAGVVAGLIPSGEGGEGGIFPKGLGEDRGVEQEGHSMSAACRAGERWSQTSGKSFPLDGSGPCFFSKARRSWRIPWWVREFGERGGQIRLMGRPWFVTRTSSPVLATWRQICEKRVLASKRPTIFTLQINQ